MPSPFADGSLVTWSNDAPQSWPLIWTPGPMAVVSARWDDGEASEYSKKFCDGGIPRKPG